ncbi:LuxR family transcriptional regulator [Streptacidiphilus sp. PB12-B1b]|uniref:helix-turn-helix transcriptional regulator n=1 Tax=Streptacidiphilus sp. PB12-B1b TaxID=2705012 RepID=UPI001CDB9A9E|nr:LuxR family transcriptional regulator [Streptacidiphilus sp. PB12-B1b]
MVKQAYRPRQVGSPMMQGAAVAAPAAGPGGSARAGSGPGGAPLIGREAEVGRILECVEAGRDRPRFLLVLGEAGSGRTELLNIATERASRSGTRVLAAQGCETEMRQSFAALHQLLLPLLGDLAGLPEHQRDALRKAFGVVPATGPAEPMVFRVAVLTLLGLAAQAGPVLLAVDDIQSCDRDSLDVLFFVTRRLTSESVTVLLAGRGEVPPPGVSAELEVLLLGPLAPRAAAQLLDAQPGAPTGGARLELLQQAEGNPLAIIELCRALRSGGAHALRNDGTPQTSRIQQMFAAQLGALPAATRRALLYSAAASTHEELTTLMAALGAGSELSVWAPAEAAGLITVADGRVVFRHPLIRTAAFHREPVQARQQAHQDLAAVLGDQPSRQAWHLAGAAIGPDESVAAALEATALLAQRRGGLYATAKALEQAARFSPLDRDRARRLAKALTAANDFGDPAWVRELYAGFAAVNRDPELLAVALCATSWALSLFSFQREAFSLLFDAWERNPPLDRTTATAMVTIAGGIAHQSGLEQHLRVLPGMLDRVTRTNRAGELGPGTTEPHYPHLTRDDIATAVLGVVRATSDPAAHATRLSETLASLPRPSDPHDSATVHRMVAVGTIAYYADESDVCVDLFRQVFVPLRAAGAMGPVAHLLAVQVDVLLATGRWTEAQELIEEAQALAAVHRLTYAELDLDALRVTLHALRGDGEPGAGLIGPGRHFVSLDENRATLARMLRARGLAALALGDHESGFRHLRSLFADDGTPVHNFLSSRSIAVLAAAAQRLGRQSEAAQVLAAVRQAEGRRPTTRMTLLMHHAAALVDQDADTEQHFRLAVVDPGAEQWPMERALARMSYAVWLRRKRRPLEAREQLATVIEAATRLGATRLAAEAGAELRASGAATVVEVTAPLAQLTAQQQQIVELAASGLSNREIGELLFLSPRTIGTHLYNVYPKLGISSRRQLRDVIERRPRWEGTSEE